MKKFVGLLAVGIVLLTFGVSQAADDSFSLEGVEFAKATSAKAPKASSLMAAKMDSGSGVWVSLYAGYDFANLGSLGTAEKSLIDYASSLGDSSSDGTGGSGILGGVAVGYDFDKRNSLSLSLENTWTSQSGLNITTGGAAGTYEKFDPSLLGVSLNYSLVIAQGGGSKTSLTLGGGFYHGAVHYQSDISGGTTLVGDFGQDGIGGTLGVSEKLDLGGSLDLGLSARFRAADFGKLVANSVTANGTPHTSGGPFILVTSTISSPYTEVLPVPTSATSLPPGVQDTDLDYTGFNADLSLTLHL